MKCLICGKNAENHHIKTRGSGGTDDEWNLMPLCRKHHTETHKTGAVTFANKYSIIMEHLVKNGWEILNGKLFHNAT